MPFDLNMSIFRLIRSEPFFAAISRHVTKIPSKAIPTAGVCVNPHTGFFELLYNPDFFDSLGDGDSKRQEVEILGVLKHEFYHLLLEHVTGRLPEGEHSKMWNIATDLAINSHLVNELPKFALIPGKSYTDPKTGQVNNTFVGMPLGLSAEQYLSLLKKKQEESSGGGDGSGGMEGAESMDDHSGWANEGSDAIDNITRQIASERIKESIRNAVEEVVKSNSGWGSVSKDMQREIMERLKSEIDWRSVLRYFVKTSQSADRQNSIKKINKRYPYVHPGRKTSRTAKIAISIDQSGSVSDEMLSIFFSELNSLAEMASFTVVPFDDRVDESKVYEWKKGTNHKKERVLSGGTNFDAPTEYVNKNGFDAHIVLTDMCAPKPKNSRCQRMWITTKSCLSNPVFSTSERILALNDS